MNSIIITSYWLEASGESPRPTGASSCDWPFDLFFLRRSKHLRIVSRLILKLMSQSSWSGGGVRSILVFPSQRVPAERFELSLIGV